MKKIFATSLIFLGILILGINSQVKASSLEQDTVLNNNIETNLNLENEETIMKYDAITGETTEVDMEEVRQLLEEKRKDETSSNYNKFNYSLKTIQPVEERTNYNILKAAPTGQLLLNSICRVKSNGGKGSGALVGKQLALTAAHCVVNGDTGEKYANFTAYPGFTRK